MARSFYRPSAETAIEDFDSAFYHAPSRRHYQMLRDGDRYLFRRYQLDARGDPINTFEVEVDWIMGSGNHSRVYLYRTAAGELYQLPLAWYSQTGSWGMAPGFDRPDHQGVERQVRRECMFCHNAYPDVPAGSDEYRAPHLFPDRLPEGIGCQRCHGPGAAHASLALTPGVPWEALQVAIINPGRLPSHLRNDICYGCHMQPSVAIPGVRRFGRADYSFHPGEPLADYLVQVDVREADREPGERFEINHHPYRLEQSPCFQGSGGELSCLSCHDPHRKVPVAERAGHYRAVCLGCHAGGDLARIPLGVGERTHGEGELDCTSCHMPKRRPQDVVRVTMTDHRIQIPPPGVDLEAPLEEQEDPDLTDVFFLDPEHAPAGIEGQIYRATTVARIGGASRAAVERLDQLLSDAGTPAAARAAPDPWLDLIPGLILQRRFDRLPQALDGLAARAPDSSLLPHWRALAAFADGDVTAAIGAARQAIELAPEQAEAHFNLGLFLAASGRFEEASRALERAIALRPNFTRAWLQLGRVQSHLERLDEAVASLRRALEIDPAFTRGYLELAAVLRRRGEEGEARRYLEHALGTVADPAPIRQALAEASEP